LRSYFDEIFVRVGFVFFPAGKQLDAEGNRDGLNNLYLVATKFMFLGSIIAALGGALWGRDFFRLWIGSSYAEPGGQPLVNTLFAILLFGSAVSVVQRIGYQVLLGTRKVGVLAVLLGVEGAANLLLSITLIRKYGLYGVALGTVIPAVLVQGIVHPIVVCRSLQISLSVYCRKVLIRPVLVLVALVPFVIVAGYFRPSTWLTLIASGAVTFIVSVAVAAFVGLSDSERHTALVRPMRVAFTKVKATAFAGKIATW
jgi:O-antigen/teichoic acid export membrane protein